MKKTIYLITVFWIAGLAGLGCDQRNQYSGVPAVQDAADAAQDNTAVDAQKQEISDLESRIGELEKKIDDLSQTPPPAQPADAEAPASPESNDSNPEGSLPTPSIPRTTLTGPVRSVDPTSTPVPSGVAASPIRNLRAPGGVGSL